MSIIEFNNTDEEKEQIKEVDALNKQLEKLEWPASANTEIKKLERKIATYRELLKTMASLLEDHVNYSINKSDLPYLTDIEYITKARNLLKKG